MIKIIHRGHRLYGENRIMGIRSVLDRGDYCEFDISYADGRWILSHDLDKIPQDTSSLEDLIHVLPRAGTLLIDLKWDFIFNRDDSFPRAFRQLEQLLSHIEIPWMIQAGHPYIVRYIAGRHTDWILGYLMDQPCPIIPVSFFMINLAHFSLPDIERLHHYGEIYGYTCRDAQHLPHYHHLKDRLKGIVIDI